MRPRNILVAGWLGFLLYAYPGYPTAGALNMLIEARFGPISDAHSPIMTELWRFLNIPFTGPLPMLLVQSGLLLWGSYVLLRQAMSERAAAIASIVVLLFPPVMTAMAVVAEDSLLAGLLVGAAALFTYADRRCKLGGLVLAMLACGMREGAWLAAGPIVVFGFVWNAAHRPALRYAIALNAWLIVVLLAMGAEAALVDVVTLRKPVAVAMTDVTGMVARAPELGEPIAAPKTPDQIAALLDARSNLRARDRKAYAATRWRLWIRLLMRPNARVATIDTAARQMRFIAAHTSRPSAIQRLLIAIMRGLAKTPLFSPLVYLIAALAVLPLARGRAAALLASGALLTFALAIVTADAEYRYMTWPIVATVLGIVLVIRERMR